MSKVLVDDLLAAFNNTTADRAPLSTQWTTQHNARKALKAMQQVLQGLQQQLRTAFLPFHDQPMKKRLDFNNTTQHNTNSNRIKGKSEIIRYDTTQHNKDSGLLVEFIEKCVSVMSDFEVLWKWRREWKGSGSAGAAGQVCCIVLCCVDVVE